MGADAPDLRFLAGAFTERTSQDGTTFGQPVVGATEYRGAWYAAAPGSALLAELDAVSLESDPFYAAPAAPTVDASNSSCDVTPDVDVVLHMANPAIQAVAEVCSIRRFDGMRFCHEHPSMQTGARRARLDLRMNRTS